MTRELHPQAEALLATLEDRGVLPTHALAVETARRKLADLFTPTGEPEPVDTVLDIAFPGPDGDVPVRVYRPAGEWPLPVLVYAHGGGWVLGDLDAYDGTARALTNAAGCIVVSVDYRLAPEHPFPAGLEDVYAATAWIADYASDLGGDPDRIAVGGDSAGGNLAGACALMARDRGGPDLAHQALLYPALNPPSLRWLDAYDRNGTGYFLEIDSMRWFYDRYLAREADVRNSYAFPLLCRDLSDLPPATIVTAEFDPLRDEGAEYVERLDAAGVDARHVNFDDMIHGFVSLVEHLDRGREGIEALADGLERSVGI